MMDLLPGEYYVEGLREMASGFLLEKDNRFKFFFSYGALDRHGSGTWTVHGDRLVLNSTARPVDGYALVKSAKTNDDDVIHIKLEGNNELVINHTFVSLDHTSKDSWELMSPGGMIQFPRKNFESVSLILEFCPEKITTVPAGDNGHNEFIFRIEPAILEVFFDNFSLQIGEGYLTGAHPLLHLEGLRYIKQPLH